MLIRKWFLDIVEQEYLKYYPQDKITGKLHYDRKYDGRGEYTNALFHQNQGN